MVNISQAAIQLSLAIIRYQETGVLPTELEGMGEGVLEILLQGLEIDVEAMTNRNATVVIKGERSIGIEVKRNGARTLFR